jgi:hypothetical protein
MAHEELKKQYEEDCKNYERPWELWEFKWNSADHWKALDRQPNWIEYAEYRRKEPPFQAGQTVLVYDRFRFAIPLRAVVVEQSGEAVEVLLLESNNNKYPAGRKVWVFTEQIKKTEQQEHPTINIGGVELPRPEVEAPKDGTQHWFIDSFNEVRFRFWGRHVDSSEKDRRYLAAGNVHLEGARAQAWADWWNEAIIKEIKENS